jgi:hypothetical protein
MGKPAPLTWEHKESKKRVRVMPWWECLEPIMTEAELAEMGMKPDRNVRIGSLVQIGWLLENEHGVWLGVGPTAADAFTEVLP